MGERQPLLWNLCLPLSQPSWLPCTRTHCSNTGMSKDVRRLADIYWLHHSVNLVFLLQWALLFAQYECEIQRLCVHSHWVIHTPFPQHRCPQFSNISRSLSNQPSHLPLPTRLCILISGHFSVPTKCMMRCTGQNPAPRTSFSLFTIVLTATSEWGCLPLFIGTYLLSQSFCGLCL